MPGNFGLKLQNSPKLPHIDDRIHCNANARVSREKGCRLQKKTNIKEMAFFCVLIRTQAKILKVEQRINSEV